MTAGSGVASISVAHAGTLMGLYEKAAGSVVTSEVVEAVSEAVDPTSPGGVTAVNCVGERIVTLLAANFPSRTLGVP